MFRPSKYRHIKESAKRIHLTLDVQLSKCASRGAGWAHRTGMGLRKSPGDGGASFQNSLD